MITNLNKIKFDFFKEYIKDILDKESQNAICLLLIIINKYFDKQKLEVSDFINRHECEYERYVDKISNIKEFAGGLDYNFSHEEIMKIILFLTMPPTIIMEVGQEIVSNVDIDEKYKELLINAYKNFRDRAIAKLYIKSLNTYMCPYCNINDFSMPNKSEYSSSFQLDHFLNKKQYPFFALTLYNLIPCCGVCNQVKSQNEFRVNPFIGENVKFSIANDKIIITSETSDNQKDLELLKIPMKYNSEFSIIKREILEIRDIAEKYNDSYIGLQNIKGIGLNDYKYWIKKALRDGLISVEDYNMYRVSKAKSEIVKIAFGNNLDIYKDIFETT